MPQLPIIKYSLKHDNMKNCHDTKHKIPNFITKLYIARHATFCQDFTMLCSITWYSTWRHSPCSMTWHATCHYHALCMTWHATWRHLPCRTWHDMSHYLSSHYLQQHVGLLRLRLIFNFEEVWVAVAWWPNVWPSQGWDVVIIILGQELFQDNVSYRG